MNIRRLLLTLLLPLLFLSTSNAQLSNQLIVDPNNESYLVYNRDSNRDGKLDPALLVGPGDPEGFLYLGAKKSDGTRVGFRQQEIIRQLGKYGGNVIYFQSVRSHGGDGEADHNPWNNHNDPASGLNPKIINQWKSWFNRMKKEGIYILFFIYDDGAHPFDDGGCSNDGAVSDNEKKFIKDLVDSFEKESNIIWVIQEEGLFVGQDKARRRPCDAARANRMRNLASLVKEYDDNKHLVGVHHNVGNPMLYPNDKQIDIYVQQADTQVKENKNSLDSLHASAVSGFDKEHRYNYFMGEAYDWHHDLMKRLDRTMLRKNYYAIALAGGHTAVLGMFTDADPTKEMLGDMRRISRFFESTNFNEMEPNDQLAYGGSRWVLAKPGSSYIAYSDDSKTIGIKGMEAGIYNLVWFDPVDGKKIHKSNVKVEAGDQSFGKPAIGPEVLLWIRRVK
jgi:hypothetical protein